MPALRRRHEGGAAGGGPGRAHHGARLEQPRRQRLLARSTRDDQGGVSLGILGLGVSTGTQEQVGSGQVAILNGDHHGGVRAVGGRVQRRAVLEQCLDGAKGPDLRRPLQRRPPLSVRHHHGRLGAKQGAHSLELRVLHGKHEGSPALLLARIHVGPSLKQCRNGFESARFRSVHERGPVGAAAGLLNRCGGRSSERGDDRWNE